MSGGGFWAAGEWTDDTAMALALAGSIAEHGLLDTADLAARYIRWANEDGKGIGGTTAASLIGARGADDARERARKTHERTGQTAGNGTVMRATPIALAAEGLPEAVDAARLDARLTHFDPAAGRASAGLCAALHAITAERDPVAAAAEVVNDGELAAAAAPAADQGGGVEATSAGVVGADPLADAVAAASAGDDAALAAMAAGREAATCWTTLAVALRALHRGTYEDGVGWAISLGGDTDTNAAVAGALLGCRSGGADIPQRWLAPLQGRALIERAAASLGEPEVAAAGGVVMRDVEDGGGDTVGRVDAGRRSPSGRRSAGLEIAVVHRPRYDDWSLPKGKLYEGEGWLDGALREVEEETGLQCEPREELASTRYFDRKSRRKRVRWWLMKPIAGEFRPNDEVDELRWLPLDEAMSTLNYEHDRELIRSVRAARWSP